MWISCYFFFRKLYSYCFHSSVIYNHSGIRFWSTSEWLSLPGFCHSLSSTHLLPESLMRIQGPRLKASCLGTAIWSKQQAEILPGGSLPFKQSLDWGVIHGSQEWWGAAAEVHPVGQGLSRMSLTHPGCQESFSLLSWAFLVVGDCWITSVSNSFKILLGKMTTTECF